MANLLQTLGAALTLSWLNLFPLAPISTAQDPEVPASIFANSLTEIQGELLPNLVMRLPREILGVSSEYLNDPNLQIRVFSSQIQKRSTVAMYRCDVGAYSCLLGTFSVTDLRSNHGKYLWEQHQTNGAPLTMGGGLKAYLLEEQPLNLTSGFSSVMWPQDGGFYTVTFPQDQRQDLLYMAVDMASNAPIYSDRN